jgi:hypothetical protein
MLKFVSIAKNAHGLPMLGVGTDKAVYTVSIPPIFMWKNNKFFERYSNVAHCGSEEDSCPTLKIQRIVFFPFFFTKKTLLPPPSGYSGFVTHKQDLDDWWIVGL